MNNKRKMTFKDKLQRMWFNIRMGLLATANILIIGLVGTFISSIPRNYKIDLMSFIKLDFTTIGGVYYTDIFVYLLLALIITYIIALLYNLLILFQRREIVNGHIFKIHKFHNTSHSDNIYHDTLKKARAISEDRDISTKWRYYPVSKKEPKNRPVIIVVKKNKGETFYY